MNIKNIFFITSIVIVSFGCGALSFLLHSASYDLVQLESCTKGTPSIVYDDDDNQMAIFCMQQHILVALADLPKHVIYAFVAAEDWDFFSHCGVSFKGIIRSFFINIAHGKIKQGASTITQQLIKLQRGDLRKRFVRKIKEQFCALILERHYSKEQILQMYINNVYFGSGLYGLGAASKRFWDKKPDQLTIAQSALLAGIVRSPGNFSPLFFPLCAVQRRNIILKQMQKLGCITEQEFISAVQEPIKIDPVHIKQTGLHIKEYIRRVIEQRFGAQQLYHGGLRIYTTINTAMQQQAEKIFIDKIIQLKNEFGPTLDGALLSVKPKTGAIKILIGGTDFCISQFNRAMQARRQMGSIFKPLVYAAALQQGMSFADTEVDEPFFLPQADGSIWQPNNYDKQFQGKMTLASALTHSNNIITIKTFLKTGSQPVINLAKKCHITSNLHPYPSLSLGCVDGTLEQAVGMFNVFANNGEYVQPFIINRVTDCFETILYTHTVKNELVMEAKIAHQVAKILSLGFARIREKFGTRILANHVISKTGTANDCRTHWFMGAIPQLTTGIYIGHDDNRSLGEDIFPVKTAFPIWYYFHKKLNLEYQEFFVDPTLKLVKIHEKTGKKWRFGRSRKSHIPILV